MPLLPILVSILTFNKRNSNEQAQNVEDNVGKVLEDDRPSDRRIDIPSDDYNDDNSSPYSLEKPVNVPPPRRRMRRRDSISVASVAAVKKPYTLSRRILHACHQFIFQSDKTLEDGYAPKYRYLPILSGLLIPCSILLEIPGLTEHWYNRLNGIEVVAYQENPKILNVGLGFSIASAVLANICLILRFLERRIKSATAAAICFLLIHDVINIIALVSFGVIHAVDDGYTYSQAYYVTLASTITSLLVTLTLILDYVRTPNFSKSGSGLTRKQRSLVIIVMILLCYLGLGALIYCSIIEIGFLDALYFAVCSTLTIGFGDISPSNTSAQVFSIFYNTFGILNTGLTIAIARETIVEAFQQSYRNRKHALAARRKLYRQVHAKHHAARHGLWLATHRFNDHLPHGIDIPVSTQPPTPLTPSIEEGASPTSVRRQQELHSDGSPTPSMLEKDAGVEELVDDPFHVEKLEEELIDEDQQTSDAAKARGIGKKPLPQRLDTDMSARNTPSTKIPSVVTGKEALPDGVDETQDVGDVETERRKEAEEQVEKVDDHMVAGFGEEETKYIQFRQDMIKEGKKEFKAKLLVSWGLFILFWVLGGIIFMLSEGWSYGIAIYFCFTAFSTIGYGDYSPKSGPGRVCFIAWSLFGVGTMTILISVLSEAYQSRYSTMIHNGLFDKAIRSYQNKTHTNKQASHPDTPMYDKDTMTREERMQALEDTRVGAAAIPPKIIAQAKVFHAHLQYVLTHNSQEKPPPGLQRALDELMDEEKLNDAVRKEVLQDGDARRTLFMMSFERTLKRMVENAERISKLIEERDSLEESLGYGLGDEDDDGNPLQYQDDEDEDAFPDSPADMRDERAYDAPTGKSNVMLDGQETSAARKGTAMSQWLKLRAGILASKPRRSDSSSQRSNRRPYLHASGSQSEPRISMSEEVGDDDSNDSSVAWPVLATGSSTRSQRRCKTHRPPRQPSKLGAVRFADNPYGNQANSVNEKDVGEDAGNASGT